MAPQVVRITIVFAAIVFLFIAIRSQIVPAGFGEDGFHRKQGPERVASAPIRHAGMKACVDCHSSKIDLTPHVKKGVHCESCHAASEAHVLNPESKKPKVPQTREDCTRCHAKIVSRPAWYPQIDPTKHNPDSRCIDCHEIHPSESSTEEQAGDGRTK